jgi:hypothetical protein
MFGQPFPVYIFKRKNYKSAPKSTSRAAFFVITILSAFHTIKEVYRAGVHTRGVVLFEI